MDERGIVSKSKLTALATAIKTKAEVSGTYTLDDLVDVVDDIETGGGGETITLSAVFDAGENKIFTTDTLDDLKQYLTVTATVSGQTSATYTIPADAYTLSGTLAAGSNTITVTWLNKSTTFTVSGVIAATNVTPTLTSVVVTSKAQYGVMNNAITVFGTSAGTYGSAGVPMTLEAGYRYRVTADCDIQKSGTIGLIYFNNSSANKAFGSTNQLSASGKLLYDGLPSDNAYFDTAPTLRFTESWSTSVIGCAHYRNLKIIKYLEVS